MLPDSRGRVRTLLLSLPSCHGGQALTMAIGSRLALPSDVSCQAFLTERIKAADTETHNEPGIWEARNETKYHHC